MESIIRIENLRKMYGGATVLQIPQLELKAGESFGLVGNNGAGKTTLFRLLLDLIAPDEGTAYLKDVPVKADESWKHFTGSYLDEGFLIDYLTPDEYFNFIGKLRGLSAAEQTEQLDRFGDLFAGEIRGKKKYIRDLSKGNQKKVGVAGALLGNPDILILDEPFANLDPSTQYQLRDMLHRLDEETDITLVISSHDLGHVTEFCQRIAVLDHGELVKDIRTNPQTLPELESFFMQKIRGEAVE